MPIELGRFNQTHQIGRALARLLAAYKLRTSRDADVKVGGSHIGRQQANDGNHNQ
jgi:hypothetical protein